MSEELTAKDHASKPPVFATQEELVDLANNMAKMEAMLGRLVEAVSKKKPVEAVVEPMDVEAGPNDIVMPASYRAVVDEVLGKDYGSTLDINDRLSIIIPREKSNAPKDWLETYKVDVRSRVLGGTGVVGVRDWCLRVRKNLERSGVKFPILN